MKIQVQVQTHETQWFCLGWFIDKNDHPSLPPYCSYPADDKEGFCAHFSMREAVEYCLQNPNFTSDVDLTQLGVSYPKPRIKEGRYFGVRWYYSEAFNCYGCELSGAEEIPFTTLAQTKLYIKDWHETVGYAE